KEWVLHATGELAEETPAEMGAANRDMVLDEIRRRCKDELAAADFYRRFDEANVHFGPNFRPITRIVHGPGEALVEFEIPSTVQADSGQYQIHPVALDACLQAAVALLFVSTEGSDGIYLPAALESLHIVGDPRTLAVAHARIQGGEKVRQGEPLTADIRAFDADGNIVLSVNGLMMRPLQQLSGTAAGESIAKSFYQVEWVPISGDPKQALDLSGICVLCGEGEMVSGVSAALEKNGVECAAIHLHNADR